MTADTTDRELLEESWQLYDEEFADHVGAIVTPYEYVDTEEQVDWVARIFMFAYGLGTVAGAHAVAPAAVDGTASQERVDDIVDAVVDIHAAESFAVSNERIKRDFLDG